MKGKSYQNFTELWSDLVENSGDAMLFRVPTQQSGQVLSFRARPFFKRAVKIANVFCQSLKMKPGDRVALLGQAPEDFALILHGAWLARIVPVVLPSGLSNERLVEILKQTGVSAAIFPPESSAKIAALFGKVPAVEHWIASGKSSTGGAGATHKLEELAVRADATVPEFSAKPVDIDGLVIATGGHSGDHSFALFSQSAVIDAAKAAAYLHPRTAPEGALYWCGLPFESLDALLHNCVAPLFSQIVAYVTPDIDMRSFWEACYADALCCTIISQEQLRAVHRRGKPRAWLKPENFVVLLYAKEALNMELLTGFEERFFTPVFPCYSVVEAGGVVAAMPQDSDAEFRKAWLEEFDVPTSGVALPGVEITITTTTGQLLGQEYMGSIRVQSPYAMKDYVGMAHKTSRLVAPSVIDTGDEGYWVRDPENRVHVFVHGRTADIIFRHDKRISPARANGVLADIRGIDWYRTVGFPNATAGYEVGAYVILKRSANLTEASIKAQLRVKLDWDECPKVVIIGEADDAGEFPEPAVIQAAFEAFYDVDYDFDRF